MLYTYFRLLLACERIVLLTSLLRAICRLSEKSFVLFIQYPLDEALATSSLARPLCDLKTAASRPNIFYPEIHEVDLWQVEAI